MATSVKTGPDKEPDVSERDVEKDGPFCRRINGPFPGDALVSQRWVQCTHTQAPCERRPTAADREAAVPR